MTLSPTSDAAAAARHQTLRRALGPDLRRMLEDADVLDIHLNGDGQLWVRHRLLGNRPTGSHLTPDEAHGLLAVLAGLTGKELTASTPRLAVVLPGWSARLQGSIPPVSDTPTFALRKPPSKVFPLLSYLTTGRAAASHLEALRAAVSSRDGHAARNVLVAGGTGSGKTTFANALLEAAVEANPAERYVILEDVPEIRCSAPNRLHLLTSPVSSPPVTLSDLVRDTLRLDPDRILIGEVRGVEALDLLKAWNTGHPGGLGTIHANDALGALQRLDLLCQETGAPSQRWLIADTVHVVAHMTGKASGIRLAEVALLHGLDASGQYVLESLTPE